MSQALILPQYPGDFSLDGHTHNYASASHSHSQYLTSHQSLTNYATKTYVDNAVAGIDTSTVPSHSHSNYASSSHTHSYASTSHTHSGYASSSHSHSGYASSSHTHSASDINGLSTGGGNVFSVSIPPMGSYTLPSTCIYFIMMAADVGNGSENRYILKYSSPNKDFGGYKYQNHTISSYTDYIWIVLTVA